MNPLWQLQQAQASAQTLPPNHHLLARVLQDVGSPWVQDTLQALIRNPPPAPESRAVLGIPFRGIWEPKQPQGNVPIGVHNSRNPSASALYFNPLARESHGDGLPAHVGRDSIAMFLGAGRHHPQEVITHEFGHVFEHRGIDRKMVEAVYKRWPEAQKLEGQYLSTHPQEHFAEVFANGLGLLRMPAERFLPQGAEVSRAATKADFWNTVKEWDASYPGIKEVIQHSLKHPMWKKHWLNDPKTPLILLNSVKAKPPKRK